MMAAASDCGRVFGGGGGGEYTGGVGVGAMAMGSDELGLMFTQLEQGAPIGDSLPACPPR